MGEIGAGKSSVRPLFFPSNLAVRRKAQFINAAAGLSLAQVGYDLDPCTSNVNHFMVKHHKNSMKSVVFVDTPGFNHPSKPDRDILEEIVHWLKNG